MKQDNKKKCAFEDCSNLAEVRGGGAIIRKRRKYCSKHHRPESREKKPTPTIVQPAKKDKLSLWKKLENFFIK